MNDTSGNSSLAIVDYGMGNLFSVERACRHVGADAIITSNPDALFAAAGVILPGVGAFTDAMDALDASGLSPALRELAAQGRPLLGVCLGLQLLMSESSEFGYRRGLGIVPGSVERLSGRGTDGEQYKVPQVGWNTIHEASPGCWAGTLLEGIHPDASVYFVHSYYVRPENRADVLSTTPYGADHFASTIRAGNVVGCQYHPELSGPSGLEIYRRFADDVAAAAHG